MMFLGGLMLKGQQEKSKFYNSFEAKAKGLSDKEDLFIIFFDGNGMKRINDRFGHLIGDFVIEEIYKTLRANLENHDELYHFGGDEFLCCIIRENPVDAINLVLRIQHQIKANINFKKKKLGLVALSAGMVKYCKETQQNGMEVTHLADMLMYEAKDNPPKFFAFTDDPNYEYEVGKYTRDDDPNKLALRLYFNFIHKSIMHKYPDFDAEVLSKVQRDVWGDWGFELLNRFTPNQAVKEFIDIYKVKTKRAV